MFILNIEQKNQDDNSYVKSIFHHLFIIVILNSLFSKQQQTNMCRGASAEIKASTCSNINFQPNDIADMQP